MLAGLLLVIRLLKHRGIQVIVLLCAYFCFASSLPQSVHQGLYTISIFIKDLLMWLLPLTVGFFIAHAISSFRHQAPLFILLLFLFEALSNLSSVWYAYAGGQISAEHLPALTLPSAHSSFSSLWQISLKRPIWWSADKGAMIGLLLGCFAALGKIPILKKGIEQGKTGAQWILTKIFSRTIPLFVLGFVARMHQTHLFQHVLVQYGLLVVWLCFFLVVYLFLLFFMGNAGSPSRTLQAIKHLLPAGGIAFTSGCSISTMPWTIEGTAKNLKDPDLAKGVIPATTNIQQIGDCIANTFLCFLLYKHFYGHSPDFLTWAHFSFIFVLARFATAAVLGGAIFIMLPIYETYLSFNAEMIAIILAFNVILDPLITSCNVVANGALCKIFEIVWTAALKACRFFALKLKWAKKPSEDMENGSS
jgi:hypothetical protein